MKKSLKENGFSVVEIIMVAVIVGLLGFIGWYVYSTQRKTNKTSETSNQTDSNQTDSNAQKAEEKDETKDWQTYTSKLERGTFKYPKDWKIISQSLNGDTEIVNIAGTNQFELTFKVAPPVATGNECSESVEEGFSQCPILHLAKLDVPNFGSLYSSVAESKNSTSNSIVMIDYSSSFKDGDRKAVLDQYDSKRTGTFSGVYVTNYWVRFYGIYVRTDIYGNKYPTDFSTSEFLNKAEVVTTQKIFKTLAY